MDRPAGDRSPVSSASGVCRGYHLGRRVLYLVTEPNTLCSANRGRGSAIVAQRLTPKVLREGYMVASARTRSAIGRTGRTRTPTGDGRHGQGTATRQSRSQEAEEGKGQGDRGGAKPERGRLAAGFRTGEEEVGKLLPIALEHPIIGARS